MKKILLPLVVFLTTFVSCTTLRPKTSNGDNSISLERRKDVEHVEGLLTMHPLTVIVPTKEKQYWCFLATNIKAIVITDDQKAAQDITGYLPVTLNPDLLVVLQGTYIDPFTYFSPEEFEDLTSKFAKLGVKLNEYKIAYAFNEALTTWTDYNKLMMYRKPGVYSGTNNFGYNQNYSNQQNNKKNVPLVDHTQDQ